MVAVRVTAPVVVVADGSGLLRYRYHGARLGLDDIAAEDAARLLDMGMIEQADDDLGEVSLDDQGDGAPGPGDGDQATGDQGDGADNGTGDGTAGAAPAAPARPRQTSPKDEWIAYAVHRGMSAEEAAGLSRAELAARLPEA
ncbi:hypothetical protein ACIBG0_40115 [Nocardia sp. NPDC050630]|uniref:hypothetical protein n=1 Tax=Nocardia sp. NPDC050630 TaxID=3364321 RepID=UPI0037A6B8C9